MSEGLSYKEILEESDRMHAMPHSGHHKKTPHSKAVKHMLTGRSQKEQMRFTKQNRDYQNKIGRAWND